MLVVAPTNQRKVGGSHSSTRSQVRNQNASRAAFAQNDSGSVRASFCQRLYNGLTTSISIPISILQPEDNEVRTIGKRHRFADTIVKPASTASGIGLPESQTGGSIVESIPDAGKYRS